MRRLRRAGIRQWPRARFRRAALASVAVRPHGRGVSVPGPACNATRLGSEASSIPGGSPVAARPQESARQPPRRLLAEPPSDSMWPIVPSAGRLPARHRGDRDTALDCAFRRPRRLQPTTLPVAALWMAAPYHPVTRASRAIFLAHPLPPLARRPLLAPVTTRFATSAPDRRPGSDRRHARLEPHPNPRRRSNARRARIGRGLRRAPRGSQGGTACAPSASGEAGAARAPRARIRPRPREADRMGGAWHRCTRSQRSFVQPVSIEPGVFGERRRARVPPFREPRARSHDGPRCAGEAAGDHDRGGRPLPGAVTAFSRGPCRHGPSA